MKKTKINKRDQKVASNILTEFMFAQNMEEVWQAWDNIYKQYELCHDPFTHTPCAPEQYYENSLEYDRQVMIEKYGHCDGLE